MRVALLVALLLGTLGTSCPGRRYGLAVRPVAVATDSTAPAAHASELVLRLASRHGLSVLQDSAYGLWTRCATAPKKDLSVCWRERADTVELWVGEERRGRGGAPLAALHDALVDSLGAQFGPDAVQACNWIGRQRAVPEGRTFRFEMDIFCEPSGAPPRAAAPGGSGRE